MRRRSAAEVSGSSRQRRSIFPASAAAFRSCASAHPAPQMASGRFGHRFRAPVYEEPILSARGRPGSARGGAPGTFFRRGRADSACRGDLAHSRRVVRRVLDTYLPLPNSGSNLVVLQNRDVDDEQYTGRVDLVLSPTDQVSVRYFDDDNLSFNLRRQRP